MNNQFRKDSHASQGSVTETAARMKETMTNHANDARDQAADLARKAADRINSQREPIADTLDRTASAIHKQGELAATAFHKTAERLETTAQYVRDNDVEAMFKKARRLTKQYPGLSLATGVALGLVVAKLLRSGD